MNHLKFASIDIGSNAVRLLFTNVYLTDDGPYFRKASLIRVPLRLGDESFRDGVISRTKVGQFVDTMNSFASLMKVHQVKDYRAYATSAMREAANAPEIVSLVKATSGIDIEIISGETEANLISTKYLPDGLPRLKKALFVDVGGGSTELTFYKNGEKVDKSSRKIGTIRLLHNSVKKKEWEKLTKWLSEHKLMESEIPIIGSGGNINKVFKMRRKSSKDMYVAASAVKDLEKELAELTVDERIVTYILNPDRADVIVPALKIFNWITDKTGSSKIYVPKSGLSDGIARELYRNHIKNFQERDRS
jgi:exopolyphosphatase/guanosine-5'-triphosphate,3'-diphosphate pyrophosphatase